MKDPHNNAAASLKEDLRMFTGSEEFYRHWLRKMIFTEGVKHFADTAGAYWFLDIIATEVIPFKEEFIAIQMIVADGKAVIFADDGNGKGLWSRQIDFTDCPEGEWKFYLVNNTLMLPSEY